MRAPMLHFVACCLLLAALPGTSAQQAGTAMTELEGRYQVPPLNTPTTGMWNATLAANRMQWTLDVFDGNSVTMAHIHQGDARTNGPVVVFLVPVGVGSAATTQTLPQLTPPRSGDMTFMGTFTEADFGGPLAGKTMQDLINLFQAGNAYVNVHDAANPSGVIRGQVEWM